MKSRIYFRLCEFIRKSLNFAKMKMEIMEVNENKELFPSRTSWIWIFHLIFLFLLFYFGKINVFYVCNMLERECEKRVIPSGPTHLDLPPTACEQNLRRWNACISLDGGKRTLDSRQVEEHRFPVAEELLWGGVLANRRLPLESCSQPWRALPDTNMKTDGCEVREACAPNPLYFLAVWPWKCQSLLEFSVPSLTWRCYYLPH